MATYTGYIGMHHPHYDGSGETPVNVFWLEYYRDEYGNDRTNHSPTVGSKSVMAVGKTNYNWGNYNWLDKSDGFQNTTFYPRNRNMGLAKQYSRTDGVTDQELFKLQPDEYPTSLKMTGTAKIAQIASGDANVDFYLVDVNHNSTRVHVVNTTAPCKSNYEKQVNSIPWPAAISDTQSAKALAGKTLGVLFDAPINGSPFFRGVTPVTITTSYDVKTVSVTDNGFGTIKINDASSKTLLRGESATVTITPNTGYELVDFNISQSGETPTTAAKIEKVGTNSYTFTMSTPALNTTISAPFTKVTYTITSGPNLSGAGIVTVAGTPQYGETITINQAPTNNEYRFDGWTVKSGNTDVAVTQVSEDGTSTFTMPAGNVSIVANYTKHAITWTGASITASQNLTDITLTYRGIAKDNFGMEMEYWIYRDGVKDTQINDVPGNTDKTITVTVSEEDQNKEMRFSLVAVNTISSGGATVSLNISDVHRLVGYYHNGQWVMCIPYYYHDGEWIEVEPFYYSGSEGWNICSLA